MTDRMIARTHSRSFDGQGAPRDVCRTCGELFPCDAFLECERADRNSVSLREMRLRAEAAIPTPDEIEAVAADIGRTGYASEAVTAFERWTLERWGVVGGGSPEEESTP